VPKRTGVSLERDTVFDDDDDDDDGGGVHEPRAIRGDVASRLTVTLAVNIRA